MFSDPARTAPLHAVARCFSPGVQVSRQKSHCVHYQCVAFPISNRMAAASRLYLGRVLFQIQVNRPLQPELAVLEYDCVFVLGDAVDGTVERPVEKDAGRFAAEAWIVFAFKICCRLSPGVCQFRSPVEARAAHGSAAPAGPAALARE